VLPKDDPDDASAASGRLAEEEGKDDDVVDVGHGEHATA